MSQAATRVGQDGGLGCAGLGRQRLQLLAEIGVEKELMADFGAFHGAAPQKDGSRSSPRPVALVHGVSARDRAETAQAVHGALVGGGVGFVLGKAEVGLMLGGNWLGDGLFRQTGMALLLQPAFFVGEAAFLIDRGGEADMKAAHLAAPIVRTRSRPVSDSRRRPTPVRLRSRDVKLRSS